MYIERPHITNDLSSPCNKKKCSPEMMQSCCGCPEWFLWKTHADAWKIGADISQESDYTAVTYAGKHLKPEDR